jgi:hypothetical protein
MPSRADSPSRIEALDQESVLWNGSIRLLGFIIVLLTLLG